MPPTSAGRTTQKAKAARSAPTSSKMMYRKPSPEKKVSNQPIQPKNECSQKFPEICRVGVLKKANRAPDNTGPEGIWSTRAVWFSGFLDGPNDQFLPSLKFLSRELACESVKYPTDRNVWNATDRNAWNAFKSPHFSRDHLECLGPRAWNEVQKMYFRMPVAFYNTIMN